MGWRSLLVRSRSITAIVIIVYFVFAELQLYITILREMGDNDAAKALLNDESVGGQLFPMHADRWGMLAEIMVYDVLCVYLLRYCVDISWMCFKFTHGWYVRCVVHFFPFM